MTTLKNQLLELTKELKEQYIQHTKEAAVRKFNELTEWASAKESVWLQKYGVKFTEEMVERPYSNRPATLECKIDKSEYHRKNYYKMQNAQRSTRAIVYGGFAKYEEKRIRDAQHHYDFSVEKLEYRLNQKGIVDGSNFVLKVAAIGINLDMTFTHGNSVTRAWTIYAHGEINEPHFRYLVK